MVSMDDLLRVRYTKRRIESLNRRRGELRDRICSITQNISGMPKGSSGDKMAEYVSKMDELDAQYAEALVALYADQLRVDMALDELPAQQATIMRMRYIECYGWRRIARESNYCEQHCRKIHKAAEKKLIESGA